MKSNRLWTACIHLTLVLVIAVEIGWIIYAVIFLVPKFQKLWVDDIIDPVIAADNGMTWMADFLDIVYVVVWRHATWLLLGAGVLAGLFEWRVKSENKTAIRLTALGTLAIVLTIISTLMGAALVAPYLQSAPMTSVMAKTFALGQIERLDASMAAVERALNEKDWDAMKAPADRASGALFGLTRIRPAVHALWSRNGPSVEQLRAHVKDASDAMRELVKAIAANDAAAAAASLRELRQSYAPLRAAANEITQ